MAEISRSNGWGGRRPGAGRPRVHRGDFDHRIVERVAYVRYLAALASKALAMATPTDWTLHAREVQLTLDNTISLLGSALNGDGRPFSDDEYRRWAAAWRSAGTVP